jgi:hypothetical protein
MLRHIPISRDQPGSSGRVDSDKFEGLVDPIDDHLVGCTRFAKSFREDADFLMSGGLRIQLHPQVDRLVGLVSALASAQADAVWIAGDSRVEPAALSGLEA